MSICVEAGSDDCAGVTGAVGTRAVSDASPPAGPGSRLPPGSKRAGHPGDRLTAVGGRGSPELRTTIPGALSRTDRHGEPLDTNDVSGEPDASGVSDPPERDPAADGAESLAGDEDLSAGEDASADEPLVEEPESAGAA